MSGVSEAVAAKARRRLAVVESMIDQVLADEDAIADVHIKRQRRKSTPPQLNP